MNRLPVGPVLAWCVVGVLAWYVIALAVWS